MSQICWHYMLLAIALLEHLKTKHLLLCQRLYNWIRFQILCALTACLLARLRLAFGVNKGGPVHERFRLVMGHRFYIATLRSWRAWIATMLVLHS